ncbi:MAG: shikimate dehydrogenase [Xenococcaceae cyanobacterium]
MLSITGKTKLLAIIGDPVEHSLSPIMHNAAIAALGLDLVYIPCPVKEKYLIEAIAGFEAIDLIGFNATIPHKQSILPLLSEITDQAKAIGAVNTVWRTDRGWSGTNTDILGFIAPLKEIERDWSQIKPVILGYGGAARAVVVGLAELGCPEIIVVGRDRHKLDKFSQSWQNSALQADLKVILWEELPGVLSETELLVNTTPIGMYPNIDESPLNESSMKKLSPNAIAYDLIYTPKPTKFLIQAKEKGAIAIDGLEMLVQQGAAGLKIWLQREDIPVDVMRQACLKGLGIRG